MGEGWIKDQTKQYKDADENKRRTIEWRRRKNEIRVYEQYYEV